MQEQECKGRNARAGMPCITALTFLPLQTVYLYMGEYYSFTLPAEILLIMYLEQKANTIKIGMTEIATAR